MVRWAPLSLDLPGEVLDFKRALRQAIDSAGYRKLEDLAAATSIARSTLSDAAGSNLKLPTEANLKTILDRANSKAPGDGRYDTWGQLFRVARLAVQTARRPASAVPTGATTVEGVPAPGVAAHLPDGDPPLLVLQDLAQGLVWYSYSEVSTAQLIARYSPAAPEPAEAADE